MIRGRWRSLQPTQASETRAGRRPVLWARDRLLVAAAPSSSALPSASCGPRCLGRRSIDRLLPRCFVLVWRGARRDLLAHPIVLRRRGRVVLVPSRTCVLTRIRFWHAMHPIPTDSRSGVWEAMCAFAVTVQTGQSVRPAMLEVTEPSRLWLHHALLPLAEPLPRLPFERDKHMCGLHSGFVWCLSASRRVSQVRLLLHRCMRGGGQRRRTHHTQTFRRGELQSA